MHGAATHVTTAAFVRSDTSDFSRMAASTCAEKLGLSAVKYSAPKNVDNGVIYSAHEQRDVQCAINALKGVMYSAQVRTCRQKAC